MADNTAFPQRENNHQLNILPWKMNFLIGKSN